MPAKFEVKITRAAQDDVEEIWNYIFADNPDQADCFIGQLKKQIGSLERYPQRCPLIVENQILGSRYRHLINGNYRTIFRVSGKTVYVLRVIHGARLMDMSILEDG